MVSFLASRVPQLQLHALAPHLNHLYFKIDPDCGEVLLWELIIRKSTQQARFPNARVTNEHKFDHLIELDS